MEYRGIIESLVKSGNIICEYKEMLNVDVLMWIFFGDGEEDYEEYLNFKYFHTITRTEGDSTMVTTKDRKGKVIENMVIGCSIEEII